MEARDIIRQMREDPALADELRAVLLSQELLHLPEVVALQGQTLARLTDRVDALTERMDALTERMDALTERMEALTERMEALTERMEALVGVVAQLARDHGELRAMLGRFIEVATGALQRVESQISALSERVDAGFTAVAAKFDRVDAELADIKRQ